MKYWYNEDYFKDVYEKSGVYFLYDISKEIIYIGQSKDIMCRFTQHQLLYHPAYYSILLIDNERERKLTEKLLIKHYLPKYNKCYKKGKLNTK